MHDLRVHNTSCFRIFFQQIFQSISLHKASSETLALLGSQVSPEIHRWKYVFFYRERLAVTNVLASHMGQCIWESPPCPLPHPASVVVAKVCLQNSNTLLQDLPVWANRGGLNSIVGQSRRFKYLNLDFCRILYCNIVRSIIKKYVFICP